MLGVINWFAVHPTSMNNTNRLISSDNVGYASILMEKALNGENTLPGKVSILETRSLDIATVIYSIRLLAKNEATAIHRHPHFHILRTFNPQKGGMHRIRVFSHSLSKPRLVIQTKLEVCSTSHLYSVWSSYCTGRAHS